MGLFRISKGVDGGVQYMIDGKKVGRVGTRDELDDRVYVAGSLDAMDAATKYCVENKDWKENYWHITFSFTNNDWDKIKENSDIMQDIHRDILSHYYCTTDIDKIINAAEIHVPKIKSYDSKIFDDNNEKNIIDRYPHMHLMVSKLDPETGNQIRMLPYDNRSQSADKAFQTELCRKYGLDDPKDFKRKNNVTREDILNRFNGVNNEKPTINQYRNALSGLVKNADSIKNAKDIIMKTGAFKSVKFIKTGKNTYLKAEPKKHFKSINLRGKGFENLNKYYYPKSYKNTLRQELKTNKEIIDRHKNWFIDSENKRGNNRENNKSLETRYNKEVKKYENYFEKYTREQRRYFMVYKNEIKDTLIDNYRIYEKANEKHLVNRTDGITIIDKPDVVSVSMSSKGESLERSIALAITLAANKGWDVKTLKVTTNNIVYKKEFEKQIAEYVNHNPVTSVAAPNEAHNAVQPPIFNSTSEAVKDVLGSKTKLNSNNFETIKRELSAESVMQYAVKYLGANTEHYEIVDNKIRDTRTRQKPRNVIDFLTKTMDMKMSDATPILIDLTNSDMKLNKVKKVATVNELNNVDARLVINALSHIDIDITQYEVTKDNKINNLTNNQKPKSVLDFLQKEHGISYADSVDILTNSANLPQTIKPQPVKKVSVIDKRIKTEPQKVARPRTREMAIGYVIKSHFNQNESQNRKTKLKGIEQVIAEYTGIKQDLVSCSTGASRDAIRVKDQLITYEDMGITKEMFISALSGKSLHVPLTPKLSNTKYAANVITIINRNLVGNNHEEHALKAALSRASGIDSANVKFTETAMKIGSKTISYSDMGITKDVLDSAMEGKYKSISTDGLEIKHS